MLNFTIWGFVSAVANIIFPLLAFIQWFLGHSRERAIKYNLIAAHRVISRIDSPEATGAIDLLDATLATLDSRRPFENWAMQKISQIKAAFLSQEKENLRNLPEIQNKIDYKS